MINDILAAIMSRLNTSEPNLKYIDEDWGQLDYYDGQNPVKFPCLLLELQQVTWKNQSQKVQDGEMLISLRIADMRLSNSNQKAPSNQRNATYAIWLILENIHKALHGWRPEQIPQFGALTRISSNKVKRDDGIREFVIVYSTLCSDSSAMNQGYSHAVPEVTPGLLK